MKQLLIESRPTLDRVAMIEDGCLAEIYYEDRSAISLVGNVYVGTVQNVLEGMQAAFIDIGTEKNAFLALTEDPKPLRSENAGKGLRKGDRVLIQVVKDAYGSKGARVTGQISIPGRYLVYSEGADFVALSRKIFEPDERKRITELLKEIKPAGSNVIARTAAVGTEREQIEADLRMLCELYGEVTARAQKAKAPCCVYEEQHLIQRTLKDLYPDQVDEILEENCPAVYEWAPDALKERIRSVEYDLFENKNIEEMVDKALQRRVWLKSGGNIYIDTVEAMTVVDVNSGKFVGRDDFEEAVTRINIEAAQEIARQLRLRDVGGIVVIDFIDMEEEASRERVVEALKEALKADRTKSRIIGFSPLGVLQMTRKKVRQQLCFALTETCSHCDSAGRVMSAKALSWRAAQLAVRCIDELDLPIVIQCEPRLAEQMSELDILRRELEGCPLAVYVAPVPGMRWGEMSVVRPGKNGLLPEACYCVTPGED